MKCRIVIAALLSIACVCGAQTRRITPSTLPCADAFSNSMRASFEMADAYKQGSRKHKHFINRGFTFGDVAMQMYGGDHSQDARLCTAKNLEKLETINKALDLPSWQDQQKAAEALDIKKFDSEESVIYADKAEKYLKAK